MLEVKEAEHIQSRPCCSVLVVGAGLGGLAAAIGIRKAGHDVIVLERMGELREVCTRYIASISISTLMLSVSGWRRHTGSAKFLEDSQEMGHFGRHHLTRRATP